MYKTPRRSRVKRVPIWFKYVISFIMLYFLVSFFASLHGLWKLKMEERHLNKVISELKTENRKLLKQFNLVRSDHYIEKVAREKLGLVKKDETLIITTDKGEKPGMWKINSNEQSTKNVTD